MSDDFMHQFDPPEPPRPEFAAALYQRISQPMITNTRARLLRTAAVSLALVAVAAAVLLLWPSARAFAESILRDFGVGGYTFVQGGAEPTVSPEELATARAFGKPVLQPAND